MVAHIVVGEQVQAMVQQVRLVVHQDAAQLLLLLPVIVGLDDHDEGDACDLGKENI